MCAYCAVGGGAKRLWALYKVLLRNTHESVVPRTHAARKGRRPARTTQSERILKLGTGRAKLARSHAFREEFAHYTARGDRDETD